MRRSAWIVVILAAAGLSGCLADSAQDSSLGADGRPFVADAAPFLQPGYDAARTGSVPGEGPLEYEVALAVALPALPVPDAAPLVLDGQVYILTRSVLPEPGSDAAPDGEDALLRLDTLTGELETLRTFDAPASTMASDGTHIYIAEADRITANLPAGGAPVWTWMFPILEGLERASFRCADAAVFDSSLYFACSQELDDRPIVGDPSLASDAFTHPVSRPLFVRLATTDGAVEAQWPPLEGAGANLNPVGGCPANDFIAMRLESLAVASPERVLVVANYEPDHFEGGDSAGQYVLYALDTERETVAWHACIAPSWYQYIYRQFVDRQPRTDVIPAVATMNDVAFVGHATLDLRDLGTGSLEHRIAVQETDELQPGYFPTTNDMTGIATEGADVWLQTAGEILHVDRSADDGRIDWRVPHGAGNFERYRPLVAGDVVYAVTPEVVRAVHAHEGRHLWSHDLSAPPPYLQEVNPTLVMRAPGMALGEALLVVVSTQGDAIVFGRTPLSIQPTVAASAQYPAVGEEVTVDVSETQLGGLGGRLVYRAEWGDGTATSWQENPRFAYTYGKAGAREARFTMRSVDDEDRVMQQSVAVVGFDVGGSPPPELNLFQQALASENQDMTFGIVGIGLAMSGGLIAIVARRRRHGRLQRELNGIDAAADPVRENPTRLVAAMEERRAHCRGLLVDGKIDESQYTVLEKHIEEVARGARTHEIRDLLDFLPHGMVTALEEMLADGRISSWEHSSFRAVLREDQILTPAQKRKVASLVDRWFALDEGRGGRQRR